MDGAEFILLINMTVSGLFAFTFLGIAAYARDNAAAPVFALGFVFAMLYFLTELLIPSIPNQKLGYMLGFTAYLITLACLVIGLARMYSSPVPWWQLGFLLAASLALIFGIYDIARSKMVGRILYQLPYCVMLLLAVWVIVRGRSNSRVQTRPFGRSWGAFDGLMAGLFSISALHFLMKPVLATLVGGVGANPNDYIQTDYALLVQSIGAGLSVAAGLLLLLSLMGELISDVTLRSETDQLSGLLNRRGFEFRAEAAIEKSKRMRQALSLIVCDIDFFKAINDTHGHSLGDRVIAIFADELRRSAVTKGGIAARMGGEEFAVLLPGHTIQSAWRFAERVRLACADLALPTARGDVPFTVSFGVTEMEFDDFFSDVYKRADGALYEAKKNGRNCVRTALPMMLDDNVVEFRGTGSGRKLI
ncbi:GGDEF domain-containing protein [Ochrobactrum sp. Marseille-Q0166]|uniref:GGDEF domain-containing protein n=1 Tax=Ochrobactrum sp. Marseille-Q0166 TaxID=2761105 RepID=UPI001654E9B9|nr:GGDEF domain-containing protein [Ochrobactrum sp. Marseille-Q0166]MBC8716446.1 GGDEF domain-containing protein [Ochrobactrum sp. Marseille-Q0166]